MIAAGIANRSSVLAFVCVSHLMRLQCVCVVLLFAMHLLSWPGWRIQHVIAVFYIICLLRQSVARVYVVACCLFGQHWESELLLRLSLAAVGGIQHCSTAVTEPAPFKTICWNHCLLACLLAGLLACLCVCMQRLDGSVLLHVTQIAGSPVVIFNHCTNRT